MEKEQVSSYITKKGDTWDLISYKVYGSSNYIENLKTSNSDFLKVVIFQEEIALIVPTIEIQNKGSTPVWF